MPTQYDQARTAVLRLLDFPEDWVALSSLQRVLGMAQNDPPHGESDGSINESRWNILMKFANYSSSMQESLQEVRKAGIV